MNQKTLPVDPQAVDQQNENLSLPPDGSLSYMIVDKETGEIFEKPAPVDELSEIDPGAGNELEQILSSRYDFKFNVVTGKLFFRNNGTVDFEEMTDYSINSVLRFVNSTGLKCSRSTLVWLLLSDFTPKFDPFLLYVEKLGHVENEPGVDYIQTWADTVQTTNQDLWRRCFKKWIVGAIGSLKDKDTVNQTAPIFCGGQGVGKTRWIDKLVPEELKPYFFSGTINMSNKDSITQLSECMIIDMDELENLGKQSIGDLKSLMTRQNIRLRRPYGKMFEHMPRRASFIGSINHKEFLKDETGSRRFLCFEVKSIDSNHSLCVDQLYAQALSLYNDPSFRYWFDLKEIEELEVNNKQFQKTFFEQEVLLNHFESSGPTQDALFLSSTKIAQHLRVREKLPVNNTSVQHIGKALAGNKFERVKKHGRYVWKVWDKKRKTKKPTQAAIVHSTDI